MSEVHRTSVVSPGGHAEQGWARWFDHRVVWGYDMREVECIRLLSVGQCGISIAAGDVGGGGGLWGG